MKVRSFLFCQEAQVKTGACQILGPGIDGITLDHYDESNPLPFEVDVYVYGVLDGSEGEFIPSLRLTWELQGVEGSVILRPRLKGIIECVVGRGYVFTVVLPLYSPGIYTARGSISKSSDDLCWTFRAELRQNEDVLRADIPDEDRYQEEED